MLTGTHYSNYISKDNSISFKNVKSLIDQSTIIRLAGHVTSGSPCVTPMRDTNTPAKFTHTPHAGTPRTHVHWGASGRVPASLLTARSGRWDVCVQGSRDSQEESAWSSVLKLRRVCKESTPYITYALRRCSSPSPRPLGMWWISITSLGKVTS